MKAMVMTAFGGPEVFTLQDIPKPEPGATDLLIEVRATALNPVDCKTRQAPRWGDRVPPMVLGFDVCGTVAAVGVDVVGFEVGDEIIASPSLVRDGANAEFVCVDYRTAAPKPVNVSALEAASLPLVSLTAWESLHEHGRMKAGETVLIQAGAGGVGHIAVQLAKQAGCKVITTIGKPDSEACVRNLYADVCIDYHKENVVERVLEETNGKGCDVVLDAVGGQVFTDCISCVAFGGRLVTIVPGVPGDNINALFKKSASLHFEFMGAKVMQDEKPEEQGEVLRRVSKLVDDGAIRPMVSQVFPLEALPEAHVQQESQRTVGKLVIQI